MPDVPWVHRKKGGASMSKKNSSLAGLQALVCARVRVGRAQETGRGVRAHPQCEGWHGAEHAA